MSLDYEAELKKYLNVGMASKALGIPVTDFYIGLKKQQHTEPLNKLGLKLADAEAAVIDGADIHGTSRYYKLEDGGLWVKTKRDEKRAAMALQEMASALCATIPKQRKTKAPENTVQDLVNCYVVTDYHMGMLAWAEEAGNDWDIDIAYKTLMRFFDYVIAASPAAEVGIFAQLGDFLHYDSLDAVTPTNKHVLDADTRFPKLVNVCVRAIREAIDKMLQKHNHLHVIMAEGNHDLASSVWLRAMMQALYENEPRITIDTTPKPFYMFEWGYTSLFFHHGHKKKMAEISKLFAGEFREVFGRTKYSYAHTGHLHHEKVIEDALMKVKQHPTLAPRDAYAARGGYLSKREASVTTYHKDFGQISDLIITPEMLKRMT